MRRVQTTVRYTSRPKEAMRSVSQVVHSVGPRHWDLGHFGDTGSTMDEDVKQVRDRVLDAAKAAVQEERDAQHAADARCARLKAFAAEAAEEEARAVKMASSPAGEQPDEPLAHWVHERGSLQNMQNAIESTASSVEATVAAMQARLAAASVEQNETRRSFQETKQQQTALAVKLAPGCILCCAHCRWPEIRVVCSPRSH